MLPMNAIESLHRLHIPNLPIKETVNHILLKAKSYSPGGKDWGKIINRIECTPDIVVVSLPLGLMGGSLALAGRADSNGELLLSIGFLAIGIISGTAETAIIKHLRGRNRILEQTNHNLRNENAALRLGKTAAFSNLESLLAPEPTSNEDALTDTAVLFAIPPGATVSGPNIQN